jgi:hypothetical protein
MSMIAASGRGEPPTGRDYGGDKNLPRSGLLEHRHAGEPQQRRCACCCGPLMPGVGRHSGEALSGP